MNDEVLIEKFLNNFQSWKTKNTYEYALKVFLNFIKKNIEKVTTKDILDFYDFLNNRTDITKKTKQLYFSAVKSLFNFLKLEKIRNKNIKLNNNIDVNFKFNWKRDEHIFQRDVLTISEIKSILKILKNKNYKYYMMFYILADTGMRANGLANLKINDINLEKRKIITLDKSKIRTYTFGRNLKRELQLFILFRKSVNCDSDNLFINMRKRPEKVKNIYYIFNKISKIANEELGIKKRITAHCLRASFKTNRRNLGQNDGDIEFFLQHNYDYRSTYLRYTDQQRLAKFDEFEML
ncbi:MAG: tyrosine-type recombinase/integrase [Candidatus Helarchaeota archaeon]